MRKFRCIGLIEKEIDAWNDDFIIGDIYEEAEDIHDASGDDCLFLWSGDYEWYVDADQFEEVNEDS